MSGTSLCMADLDTAALTLVLEAMRQGRTSIRLRRRASNGAAEDGPPLYVVYAEDYLGPTPEKKWSRRSA